MNTTLPSLHYYNITGDLFKYQVKSLSLPSGVMLKLKTIQISTYNNGLLVDLLMCQTFLPNAWKSKFAKLSHYKVHQMLPVYLILEFLHHFQCYLLHPKEELQLFLIKYWFYPSNTSSSSLSFVKPLQNPRNLSRKVKQGPRFQKVLKEMSNWNLTTLWNSYQMVNLNWFDIARVVM